MRRTAAIALAALLAPCLTAEAGLILSIESTTVKAGSTGDSFDVTLTNTGPTAVIGIHVFQFELQASNGDVSFIFNSDKSGVTTATADPYIFAGHSFLGPNIGLSFNPGNSRVAGIDDYSPPGGVDLAAGATVGLGHVFFNAGPATGVTTISVFTDPANPTEVGTNDGHFIQLMSDPGTITVTPQFSAAPEPSSRAMACGAALIGGGAWWRKRRRAA
jgi:hypothetical protein